MYLICCFLFKAKNVLDSINAKYEVLELDLRDDGNAIQVLPATRLKESTSAIDITESCWIHRTPSIL